MYFVGIARSWSKPVDDVGALYLDFRVSLESTEKLSPRRRMRIAVQKLAVDRFLPMAEASDSLTPIDSTRRKQGRHHDKK